MSASGTLKLAMAKMSGSPYELFFLPVGLGTMRPPGMLVVESIHEHPRAQSCPGIAGMVLCLWPNSFLLWRHSLSTHQLYYTEFFKNPLRRQSTQKELCSKGKSLEVLLSLKSRAEWTRNEEVWTGQAPPRETSKGKRDISFISDLRVWRSELYLLPSPILKLHEDPCCKGT